jgi:hypothetical protein
MLYETNAWYRIETTRLYIIWHAFHTVSHMGGIKTTIVIDEETLNEFKRFVSSKYGSSRMTSTAVEEALKSFNAIEYLKSFSNAMKLDIIAYPSAKEVRDGRPKLRTSSAKEVRELRDGRQNRLSRLK